MPEYQTPGVYIEELPGETTKIVGVSTSVTAFVGVARKGELNKPLSVRSFADYEKSFGTLSSGTHLDYALYQYFLNGGTEAWVVCVRHVTEDGDRAALAETVLGDPKKRTGLYALDTVEFDLLCLPGVVDGKLLSTALTYCEKRSVFLIADLPEDATPAELTRPQNSLIQTLRSGAATFGALYYPWIELGVPASKGTINYPPSGTIAGLYARADSVDGVWKAPAGREMTLTGVSNLAKILNGAENDQLNQAGVNCLRSFGQIGLVCWGARTIAGYSGAPSENIRYVPVRRLATYITKSILEGTRWAVFQPNDESLWADLRRDIEHFMYTLWRVGGLSGNSGSEAYFVTCDRTTMTQDDITEGRVRMIIGFAPLKPAEFVVLTIEQMTVQSEL